MNTQSDEPFENLKSRTPLFGPDPVPGDFATKGGGLLSLRPGSFYAASTDLMASPSDLAGMVERYPSIAIPAGVLFGTADRVLDHRIHGERLAASLSGLDLEFDRRGRTHAPSLGPRPGCPLHCPHGKLPSGRCPGRSRRLGGRVALDCFQRPGGEGFSR